MNSAEFSASADSAAVPTAGEQLAAARQSRGMSIGEIAQQLKLSPWQVEALESNDVKRLPSPVFVRGFIRNYARLLKLDPALVMPVVEHHVSAAPLTHATLEKSAEIPFPAAGHTNWSRYAIAAAVVLIPLAVYEFYPTDGSEPDVKSDGVQPPVQAVAESASASGLTVATAPLLTTAVDEVKAASRPPAGAEAAALTRRAPGEQIVKLHFTRASWVEIRDRNGQKIFSQLNEAGTDQVVSGLAPLSLVVGNANGVQLTHNEQPVNLEPYIKVDVARLTLK